MILKYSALFLMVVVLELLYFKIAEKCNIVDVPNNRSSHTSKTLLGGGIIILLGMWLYAAFFGLEYIWFLLGLSIIGIISFIDDIHSVPYRIRLIFHFAAMLLMFYQFGLFTVDSWWMIIIALVFCTGIINAFNFMDGINGMTGGYALAVLLPLLLLDLKDSFADVNIIYITGMSVVVFCFFNYRKKAKCFAGDVGSVSIAFILVFLMGSAMLKTGNYYYLIFMGVYGVDTILTIVHRIFLKEIIFHPHRKHAYQIMANELKMPQVLVSSIYMIIQVVISMGALYLPINKWLYFFIAIFVLSAAYCLFMIKYYHLHREYLKEINA